VFTGGVGERSASVRELTTDALGFLGVAIDKQRNLAMTADCEISAAGSSAATIALVAREDLVIADQVRSVLGDDS